MKAVAVGGLLILGMALLAVDYIDASRAADGVIARNGQGKGNKKEEWEVKLQGENERNVVEINIAEQQYSKKESRELFDRVIRQMEQLILGENESLDRIEKNMKLVTEVPDEPVEIFWELDRYDVMNIRGELQKEYLEEGGTLVGLHAILTYSGDREEQALYECTVCVYPRTLDGSEKRSSQMKEEIQQKEEKSRTQKEWKLPEQLLGKKAFYYKKMDNRGLILVIMAVLMGILWYALEIQKQGKEQEKRKQQMLLDYPEIVSKMTLFIGAGMTVKRAWKKIAEDYGSQKEIWGERYAYEEMKRTCYEMESGIAEAESYENFGRRCDIHAFIRFGALLSQNLRKGTKGLTDLFKMESLQAFEERKARAKRLGEEAGTKLLLPMFLMLAIVLVIVIVPAFLSVQM